MTDNVVKYKSFAADLLRDPNNPTTLVDQFALLSNDGQRQNTKYYWNLAKRAAEIAPDKLEPVFNLGGAYERIGEYEKALELFQKCLPLAHAEFMPQLLHDIGVAYRGLGDNEQAIAFYDRAIELDPKPMWRRDRAISMMAAATMGLGSFVEALKAFEARRECAEEKYKAAGVLVAQQKLPAGVVHWQGENIVDKTIVVYHEEGAGDFIQMCRFIPHLWARYKAGKIFLTGPQPGLLELVNDNLKLDGIVPLSGPFECDYVIGSMSLPWRVGIEYGPQKGLHPLRWVQGSSPYLAAEPANIPLRGELNVGLVWRGNPVYARDHMRSMAFEKLTPLFALPECAFYSLQVGDAAAEISHLGFDGFVADLQPFMKNWRQTARCIAALDVVVTVDTAVAHLAGAMGKPVFILVTKGCDWRWNRRSDKTAWYQSARVIRQKKQDVWEPCIEEVKSRLQEMVFARRRQAERENGSVSESKRAVAG